MAIDQITSGEVLNSANIGAKGVDSGKKAEKARDAMRTHLLRSADNILEGLSMKKASV